MNPPFNFTTGPVDQANLLHWSAILKGPEDTPYQGAKFNLDIKLPSDYPFSPPIVTFITKVYHPNIDSQGVICLDILKDRWLASFTISHVLYSISSLLMDPNPDDPMVASIALQYRTDLELYKITAREWANMYAMEGSWLNSKYAIAAV